MYINLITRSNQSHPAPGYVLLSPEQETMYLEYQGFVKVTSTDPLEIEPDAEAYNAWKEWESAQPVPEPEPTAQDDADAMLVDHEYRLTLLELGLEVTA